MKRIQRRLFFFLRNLLWWADELLYAWELRLDLPTPKEPHMYTRVQPHLSEGVRYTGHHGKLMK